MNFALLTEEISTDRTIVLVVDDSLTAREMIVQYLHQFDFQIVTASNGEEAIEQIGKYKPSVIILDVVLPDRSGFAICRDLKATAETTDIPVILCSIKKSHADRFWGLKQGAAAYLAKPVAEEDLLYAVRTCLGMKAE